MDWKGRKDTVYTPQKDFADLTGLNSLPQVKLQLEAVGNTSGQSNELRVRIKNPSNSVAFMVHLRLYKRENGDDVTPVFWDDNYFSLLPGEGKTVAGTFSPADLHLEQAALRVDGYNIVPSEDATAH
jgi:exo-1,4-beta-D-glucosaminidase